MFSKKLTRHTNKWENTAHSEEENEAAKSIPEEMQALDALDQDLKMTILNMPFKRAEGKQIKNENKSRKQHTTTK